MGRMEILMGVERRRDWSDEEKLLILQKAAEPDAKIADVARWQDIKPQQISTWRRKFTAGQAEPLVSFLPVARIAAGSSDEAEQPAPTDKPPAKRAARPMRIEIGCKGGRVLKSGGQHCA
jgi:transposase